MNKLILYKKNQVKSLDAKTSFNLKNKFVNFTEQKNNFLNNKSIIYDKNIAKNKIKKEDISILSKANLDILKRLTTFAKAEMLNNSTDTPKVNKNAIVNMESLDSLTKLKNKIIKTKNSIKRMQKKNLNKKNKSIYNSCINTSDLMNKLKIKKKYSLNKKKSIKKQRKRNSVVDNIQNNFISKNFFNEIKEDRLFCLKHISCKNLEMNYEMKKKNNFEEFMNEVEIMKINNSLRKDINFIKLKRKISKIKDSFQNKPKNYNKNNNIEKYRIIKRGKILYDSLDEDDFKEELLGFYISPDSWYIKFFDIILLLISISYSIFVPFLLSVNYISKKDNKLLNYILLLIDIIYIIDCFLCLFKGYKNFYEHLIIKPKKIMIHYLKTWFIIDFLQSIPFFSLIIYNIFSVKFTLDYKFEILLLIKVIKLFKLFYYNTTITNISESISSNEIIDNYGGIVLTIFIILIILNIASCLFIFIGKNSYPSWIIKINMQDDIYLEQYLTSIYFIIVTITTVGYGDITGITHNELFFQICLLIVGTIGYSFTISYISNMIIKTNEKSKNFEKNMEIINEIKLNNPHMKNSLYNELLRNVYNMKLYEKKDKHILLDSLPLSLKNILIIRMNQYIINNFIFFKNIDNSDFIIKVVNSFVPIISIKDDIIIQEGDYIKEIIFIKRGLISLNITFDINDIEFSLNKYIYKNQIGKYNIHFSKKVNLKKKSLSLNNTLDSSYSEINSNLNKNNLLEIKIVEIRNNEHFGDALMLLNERSPINAKIRTKSAELLMLRKIEAIEIYSLYPNIWKRINKISLHNMEQIYLKIRKYVIKYAKINNIDLNKNLTKRKRNTSIKKNIKKIRFKEESKNDEINNNFYDNKTDENGKQTKVETKKCLNNKDIINVIQQTNIHRNLIQILNIPKTNNNLTNIKSYFQNTSDIFKDKILNTTDTKYNIKKKKRNSTISPCLSKNTDESIILKIDKMKEKLIYNSFANLKQTKQKSFQISSSYQNINTLSNNKYIKDANLQSKITQILKSEKNENEEKTTFLNYPKTTINIKNKATFDASLINNNINTENDNITHKSSSKLLSLNLDIHHKTKIKRIQTRKKSSKIHRQLNIITKNIENASNNINNPNSFYSNFFKNIIDKKTRKTNTNSYNKSKTHKVRKTEDKIGLNLFKYYLKDKNISENKEEIKNNEK